MWIRIFALMATTLALSGCGETIVDYKYRLTLEVEADGKVYRGSSVVQVWLSRSAASPISTANVLRRARGEATVVDLGEGRLLVALITGTGHYTNDPWMPGNKVSARDLTPDELPRLVSFKNPNDPKTAFLVDPNNLTEAFGRGVKWRRIRIELADGERLTRQIDRQFPWLMEIDGGYLHGGRTSRGAPLGLHGGNFKMLR